MKVLSIRQPWAWLIIHGGKDIENRSWPTSLRGRFLVHASKGMTREEYADAALFAERIGVRVPHREDLQRGGIIGAATLTGCVRESTSPWFFGPWGFVLSDPEALPFAPTRGALGFFEEPRP